MNSAGSSASTSANYEKPVLRIRHKEIIPTEEEVVQTESDIFEQISTYSSTSSLMQQKETQSSPIKPDLSKFKLPVLKKLKPKSASRKQAKREHIPVEYDQAVPNKLKKESPKEKQTEPTDQPRTNKPPLHWEEVLEHLREMRKAIIAPVDTMGANHCLDKTAKPKEKRFQALLALMLSSQTKDDVTYGAMMRLRDHGCTVNNILNTSDDKLAELIFPVSFWKTKVRHIRRTATMIKRDFNGDIPRTCRELCKFPGVGPKMAHLCMATAWGETTGIGVDCHVHRIANRLGWVETKTPEETRKALEAWLPQRLWNELNQLLVGFGQVICSAVKPQCLNCLNNKLCPYGQELVEGAKKKK